MAHKIRFMKFFVTNGTEKSKVWYSLDNRGANNPCVTLYSREYNRALGHIFAGQGSTYENHTDIMTDYFDKGHVTLFPGEPWYEAARARAEQNRKRA